MRFFREGGRHARMTDDPESGNKPKTGTFAADLKVLKKMTPYLWPKNQIGLRIRVVASMLLLVGAKVFTVVTPITYKFAIDDLAASPPVFPWHWVLIYALFRWFSNAAVDMRDAAFVKVSQFAQNSASMDTFNHLHNLSLSYHLQRQTGGVLKALERGSNGISSILSMLLFNIVPTFVELFFVCTVLLSLYEIWFSVFTLVTIIGYVTFTLLVTEWRSKFRREMNEKDNEANNKAVDSLLNFETVKYFCNERHEAARYQVSLDAKMDAAMKSQFSLVALNVGQSGIIAVGCLAVMLLAAKEAVNGDMTVGDFVLVNTYLLQLYLPLNFLGTAFLRTLSPLISALLIVCPAALSSSGVSYRMIKQALVDLENMFTLLEEPVKIEDAEDAEELDLFDGHVAFNNVMFSYDNKTTILKGVTFEIPAGNTVAIVGPTGSGKSTMSRLLYRFYDVNSGSILLDDQDIRKVTQRSLRKAIGVVPQDTVLFNDTIFYNITYGRVDATQEDVEHAARLAQIHDFIVGLPDGYQTKVGERGLRLSGGEKQRVAIARAILKDPQIMIFDEATSALDTGTEKEIQAALREVSKGKTTLMVAHRLSTIIDADEILVLREGEIVERGSHEQLISRRGEYYEMWMKQLEQADAAAVGQDGGPAAAAEGVLVDINGAGPSAPSPHHV